jgi:hypothetical protein
MTHPTFTEKTLGIGDIIQGCWVKNIKPTEVESISPDVNRLPITDAAEIIETIDLINDSEQFVVAGDGKKVKLYTVGQYPLGEIVLRDGIKHFYDDQLAKVIVIVMACD